MAEYDIAFGKKLAETAKIVLDLGTDSHDAIRTVTYLSLLSTEISLKAMLEKAGISPSAIRKHNHSLRALLKDICGCEVEVEVAPGLLQFTSAARLCPIEIPYKNAKTPVGRVIEAEKEGASLYPIKIRYGDSFSHFAPEVLAGMAKAVAGFATEHWGSIRVRALSN